jgi:pheromone shutdown protein TraB
MITLIGTGHVFDLSTALHIVFNEKIPDVICVELDQQRYQALLNKRRDPTVSHTPSKNLPFIYRLLSRFQQSMAEQYGVNAGDEMLSAAEYARTHQIPLELIDMNAQKLFLNMWKSMSFREKIKLIFSGFSGFFVSKKQVEKELKHFQDNFDDYIEKIGMQFPTIKHILIDKRNDHMVKRILSLSEQYHQIIACLGDGHLPGIAEILKGKNQEFEVIRLQNLRNLSSKPSNTSEAHFSINYSSPDN